MKTQATTKPSVTSAKSKVVKAAKPAKTRKEASPSQKTAKANDETRRDHIVFNNQVHDKIEKYKWRSISDRPGKFMMLPKNVIRVDPSYQRPENTNKARTIAADFSWMAFGTAAIAHREDGTFWAYDSQHRIVAAQMRSDISMIPCMVYKVDDIREEAAGFLNANVNRKPLAYIHKHNAHIIRGDESAIALHDLLVKHDYTPIKGRKEGRYIACLAVLAKNIKTDREAMERVFPVIIDAAANGFILERLLDGFFYLERYGSQTLLTKRWRDRVKKIQPLEYERAINLAAASFIRGGAKRFAQGIADLLNRGMRERIELLPKPRQE